MSVKEFYEKMYKNKIENIKPTKESFFYHKLRRFKLNRNELVIENIRKGNRLLEIGCGDGELLFRLKEKYREVFGIDIAKSRIDRINRKLEAGTNIHVKTGDANRRIEFEDNYFDTIVTVDVLEHFFDPYPFMKECSRLLQPNGTLIVHTPNVAFLPNRFRLLFGKLPVTSCETGWDGGHLHYFTKSSLKKLFEDEGFEVLKITYGGIFHKFRRWWGTLFCGDILIVGVKK